MGRLDPVDVEVRWTRGVLAVINHVVDEAQVADNDIVAISNVDLVAGLTAEDDIVACRILVELGVNDIVAADLRIDRVEAHRVADEAVGVVAHATISEDGHNLAGFVVVDDAAAITKDDVVAGAHRDGVAITATEDDE